MKDTYGNGTYPFSSRIISRPFLFAQNGDSPNPDRDIFLHSLLELGKSLIGDPFRGCCDIDRYPAASISIPYWYEDVIATFSQSSGYTIQKLISSETTQAAMDSIIEQVSNHRKYLANKQGLNPGRGGYDIPALVTAFKTLWRENMFLDARLELAEEIFFSAADGVGRSRLYCLLDKERAQATLEWMARSNNARRVAFMFLYSRLAQHYGEWDEMTQSTVSRVIEDLTAGKRNEAIQTLAFDPERYIVPKPGMRRSENQPAREIQERAGLADSAAVMVKDYERLRNGSWARAMMRELTPAPSSMPGAGAPRPS